MKLVNVSLAGGTVPGFEVEDICLVHIQWVYIEVSMSLSSQGKRYPQTGHIL
jgi:hypothetical protein